MSHSDMSEAYRNRSRELMEQFGVYEALKGWKRKVDAHMNGELSELERQHGCGDAPKKLTCYTVTVQTADGRTQHPVLAKDSVDAVLIGISLAFPGLESPPLFNMKVSVEAFK